MNPLDFLQLRIIDIFDIVLVAILLYYIYRLVKGTAAINIFTGIVIVYLIWKLTDILQMNVLSNILGGFISDDRDFGGHRDMIWIVWCDGGEYMVNERNDDIMYLTSSLHLKG